MSSKVFEHDYDNVQIRRFFQDIEHSIKLINREFISEIVGEVSRDAFVNVSKTVAKFRANYLAQVIELEKADNISVEDIKKLRQARLMFEEAMEGFSSLQHALTRGYFSFTGE